MEPTVNTVVVTTKKLFHIDKKRKDEGQDWDEVNWDSDLEGEYSEDRDTHIKIINSSNTVLKEMFEMQKRTDGQKFCDVNLLGKNGYVPCHRIVLMEKSEFLTKLITENMKINMPFSGHKDLNNIISICIDVDADTLKHVVTLFYTGFCIVANSNEEDEVKDILRLLQVDVKGFSILDAATSTAAIRKKKIRSATVCRFADPNQEEIQSTSAPKNVTAPSSTVMATSSNEIRPSSSSQNQIPGPSPNTASSSRGLADMLPEIRKIPPGSYSKKPAERIQRNNDSRPSTSTPAPTRPSTQDDSDSDEPEALKAPLPVVQKVPPGTLLPLHKQPRIIRNVSRGGRRGRGRGARGGRGRGRATRSTTPGATGEPEDEDSNGPKGKYERDNDYVPSAREEVVEEEDVELESAGEDESMELSDSENRRPRTRTSSSKLDEEHGRYPKRRRREEGSYAKIVSGMANQEHDSPNKPNEIENSPIESLMDAHRPARTRGTGVSPAGKLRSLTSHLDEVSQPQCVECQEVFEDVEELKSHLDANCGKYWTSQYDIFKQYCVTCKSYFKTYALKEFLEHVKICVLGASVRTRRTSAKSTESNKVASMNASPVRPAACHFPELTRDAEPEPSTSDAKYIACKQKKMCDIIGLTPAKPLVDRLSDEQIKRLIQKVSQGENLTFSKVPGHVYVFPNGNLDEGENEIDNTDLDAPTAEQTPIPPPAEQTPIPPPAEQTPIPPPAEKTPVPPSVEQMPASHVEQIPASRVEQTPASRIEQTPPPFVTPKPNETFPSVSTSAFVPDFTSTPLSPKAKEDVAVHQARRTFGPSKPRPGPLRSKSKAIQSSTENNVQKTSETNTTQDESKIPPATNNELENNSQDRLTRQLSISIDTENNILEQTVVPQPPPPSNEPKENSGPSANATCKGTAALNATASRLKATLKKKLNNTQSCSSFAGDIPQRNITAVTVTHGPNMQFDEVTAVNSTSEAAQSVEKNRPNLSSQKSNAEMGIKHTTASAIYNKTIEKLVSRTDNTSSVSTGGTSSVTEHNQQRYSPISSASSRTSTPENRSTPISSQQQQQNPQLASTAATTTGSVQNSNVDTGSRNELALSTTSAPAPVSSSLVAASTSASQNLLTLLQNKPVQSSTSVSTIPVMQQVQQVRFPGQQPIAIRSRHQNTAIRSQLHQPRVQSVPPAVPLGASGIQHLTSETTIHPVVNSSVVAVSLFPQTKNPTTTRPQNTYSQQASSGTTNASLEFDGGLEVRRVNVPQPAAQPTVRTVSPANNHTQQAHQQQQRYTPPTTMSSVQQQQQRYTPPTTMSSVQQQQQRYTPPTNVTSVQQLPQHPLPPSSVAMTQQTFNTGTSHVRQSPISSNAQPKLLAASTLSQQVLQLQQPVNHGTLPQNSQVQHAQYIRPMSAPIQNQNHPSTAFPSIQQFVPPSSNTIARQISQNRPVSSTVVQPHAQQYQQVSTNPAMASISQYQPLSSSAVPYQQHQPNQQGVPVSRSVHVTHDGMLYNHVAAAPPSSTPNVSIIQSGATGYTSSQGSNYGNGSSATVRLPVSPFMNPLVNNRSGQGMIQQQTQQLQLPQSSSLINSIQPLAPAATLSNNITSGEQSTSEPGRFTCEDCGDIFETKQSYNDHKNDGFC